MILHPNQRVEEAWDPQRLLSSDYKALGPPRKVTEAFENHLLTSSKCLASIVDILFLETGATGCHDYSLQFDMHDFLQANPVLGNLLLRYPANLLPLLEESIISAQKSIIGRIDVFYKLYNKDNENQSRQMKSTAKIKGIQGTRVHARLVNLPPHSSNHKPSLSILSSSDVGKILQLSGTVTRTSTVQMYESERAYQCKQTKSKKKPSGCGATFVIKADLQQSNNALMHPVKCPTPGCHGKEFEVIQEGNTGDAAFTNGKKYRSDYQEIRVQESIAFNSSKKNQRMGGVIPKALLIKLQHDLVDKCQPGDDVVVVGTLMSHWEPLSIQSEVSIGMVMLAHSIRVVSNGAGGSDENSGAWDGIFDSDQNDTGSGDNSGNSQSKVGLVKEEIVKEFDQFWKMEAHMRNPIMARNCICKAICPTLYGLSLVKLALLLTLIGGSGEHNHVSDALKTQDEVSSGSRRDIEIEVDDDLDAPVQFDLDNDFDGSQTEDQHSNIFHQSPKSQTPQNNTDKAKGALKTRRREQCHVLLVGDPGCGKSQILRYAAALCPRSVFTNGSGTSSAGLTCAAVQEKNTGQWVLEAGALVLADRGVCAIDEFACIKPTDRTSIHEAMEQQTLSVAKAGIVCKLNCRTSVVAVCNAKGGYYDNDKPFTVNVGIEPPLLSRFDLVFKLIDGSDAVKDDNVATFLLNRAIQGAGFDCKKSSNSFGTMTAWNMDKLRAYIATIKSRFHPSISQSASMLLERHYSECRMSEYIEIQVTVRLLESLIRLSQAHARLMYRNVVELDDAVAVILLMECSVASTSPSSAFNPLFKDPATTVFQDEEGEADIEFLSEKKKLLEKYNMGEFITKEEHEIIHRHGGESVYMGNEPTWDSVEAKQASNYSVPTFPSQGPTDYYEQDFVTTQDHYGRYTQQKATPSPSSTVRYDNVTGKDLDDRRKPKRRRNVD